MSIAPRFILPLANTLNRFMKSLYLYSTESCFYLQILTLIFNSANDKSSHDEST